MPLKNINKINGIRKQWNGGCKRIRLPNRWGWPCSERRTSPNGVMPERNVVMPERKDQPMAGFCCLPLIPLQYHRLLTRIVLTGHPGMVQFTLVNSAKHMVADKYLLTILIIISILSLVIICANLTGNQNEQQKSLPRY